VIHIDGLGIEQVEEEADDEGGDRKIYGVTVGQVINPVDPMTMGRVQVRIPSVDALDLSPWARIAVPMAGILHGTYFVPQIGDEVLLAFEHGDPNAPYIIGSVHNALHPPPLVSPLPEIRAIRTIAGNQIVFSEFTETVAIQTGPTPPEALPAPPTPTGPYQTIIMSPAGIQIMTPTGITMVTPAQVTVQVAGTTFSVTPAGVVITAPVIEMIAAGEVSITGSIVRINS
jgi:phage baseplate assembly protein gpV